MTSVTRKGHVVEIECESAFEFLEVLDPLNGVFLHTPLFGVYVFRGASSAQFDLCPSAFRPNARLIGDGGYVHGPLPILSVQCAAELFTLRRFFEIASRQGYPLPEDSQLLRRTLQDWDDRLSYKYVDAFEPYTWPPVEFLSLIALAQHHGVPTRALDWSWSALTAAYFASCSALDNSGPTPSRIAVWAFNYMEDELAQIVESHDATRSILLYTAPGSDNPNLRAQRGLFMLQRHSVEHHLTPFLPQPYDAVLAEWSAKNLIRRDVFKVTVPAAESPMILATLAAAGVTASSLFPGLWGVAREMEEERLFSGQRISIRSTDRAQALKDEVLKVVMMPYRTDV